MKKISSVCIVGGGSSGWMTAAALAVRLPQLKVTVIESPDIKTLGVGESTLGHINRFLYALDILDKEKEWMPECDATYKVSIGFNDFKEVGHSFQYPFGNVDPSCGGNIDSWWNIKNLIPDYDVSYSEFVNPITFLADTNKLVSNNNFIKNFKFEFDTAYHLNAIKFGQMLRKRICIPNGVNWIQDEVCDVKLFTDNPGIEYVKLKSDGSKIYSDLFIDCTGFKSYLLEQSLGVKFQKFPNLMTDRAISGRIPYINKEKELKNVTDCTALSSGWVWEAPLWSDIGSGYVFSSDFLTNDEAEKEYREFVAKKIGKEEEEKLSFNVINFKHGKHDVAWVGNTVAIGPSYGFIEPLESGGLFTTHENILNLIDTLERRNGLVSKIDIDGFNYAANYSLESFKDFVALHYTFSQRTDSPFWKYATDGVNHIPPEWITNGSMRSPRLYKEFLHNVNVAHAQSDLEGLLYISSEMGYTPIGTTETRYRCFKKRYLDKEYLISLAEERKQVKKDCLQNLSTCQSTYEFLKENIYV